MDLLGNRAILARFRSRWLLRRTPHDAYRQKLFADINAGAVFNHRWDHSSLLFRLKRAGAYLYKLLCEPKLIPGCAPRQLTRFILGACAAITPVRSTGSSPPLIMR